MYVKKAVSEKEKFLFSRGGDSSMVSKYHSTVEKGILLLGQEGIKQKKIKKVLRGNENPLSIVDHTTKYVVNYQPDVYFILRNNKKLIFEVLDSEEQKQDIIIADVIRSFLVENVEALLFIYSGSESDYKRIMEALVTISRSLIYKGVNADEIPFDKSSTLLVRKERECPEFC